MARGSPHPPEVRAAVVSALVSGQQLSKVCKQYGVSRSTALFWRNADFGSVQPMHAHTRESVGRLILDTVIDSLEALRVQARVIGREDWVEKQSAAELAELRKVEWDRLLRLLAGFQSEDQPKLGPGEDVPP